MTNIDFFMLVKKIKNITYKYPFFRALLFPVIIVRRFFLQVKFRHQEEIYQNLCEMLAEDPVIRVKEFDGIYAVGCQSDLFKGLIMARNYESDLARYCLRFLDKQRDIVDVGANIGFYTVLFAKNLHKRKVLSIEPTEAAFERLRKNIHRNAVQDKVIIFEGAASNYSGVADIKILEGKEEYSTLGAWQHPSISHDKYILKRVKVESVDNLVIQNSLDVGLMKVDVEGFEHFVFDGAKKVLAMHRPFILSELSNPLLKKNGSSSIEVINFLKGCGYEVKDAFFPDAVPESRDFTNIFAVPKEMKL